MVGALLPESGKIGVQEHLLFHASRIDGSRLWSLLSTVIDFVVFHELGHSYDKLSTSSKRALLRVTTVDASFSAIMDDDPENVRYLVSPMIVDGFKTYYGDHPREAGTAELKRLSDAGYLREERGVWKFIADE